MVRSSSDRTACLGLAIDSLTSSPSPFFSSSRSIRSITASIRRPQGFLPPRFLILSVGTPLLERDCGSGSGLKRPSERLWPQPCLMKRPPSRPPANRKSGPGHPGPASSHPDTIGSSSKLAPMRSGSHDVTALRGSSSPDPGDPALERNWNDDDDPRRSPGSQASSRKVRGRTGGSRKGQAFVSTRIRPG